MKVCPQCQKSFPDSAAVCPHDGAQLRAAASNARGGSSAPTPPKTPQRRRSSQPQRASRPQQKSSRPQQNPTAPQKGDLVGRTFFGEYTIVKKLGEGGMGAVYLARQNAIDQTVALKVLHARAAESDEIVQRFHREAKVISMLSHPNIVRVFIFGRTDDDLLYLVMEYVEGRELRHSLDRQGTLDELLAIKIMKQTCSALAEAHDLGIIHRDLKPDNILLTKFRGENNFVKILDFGIAKLNEPEGEQQQKLTQAGIVYGTPEYLSPEQAQAIELDHRTDIYSLGCILYELLAGQVPFTHKNPVQVLTKHVYEEPPKPSEVASGPIAPTMENLIMKAMAKDPNERFADAMAMFEALVMREREILAERELDTSDAYFPGSELTGMHQVSKLHEYLEEQKRQHASVQSTEMRADGGSPRDVGTADTMAMDTGKAQAVIQQSAQPAQQAQLAPQQPPQPAASDDSNRHIIIIAIGAMVFILLVLLGIIGILLFTK